MRHDNDQHGTGQESGTRATVYEAAQILGVTVDAIRKRVQRGTIPHQKDESGRVWVLLEAASTIQDATSTVPDGSSGTVQDGDQDELMSTLQEQVGFLKEELGARNEELRRREEEHREESRRKDHLLAAALERIPELPPPEASQEESSDSSEAASDLRPGVNDTHGGEVGLEADTQQRSWLMRFFFGP
jgi:acyl transferase domain-containing protein